MFVLFNIYHAMLLEVSGVVFQEPLEMNEITLWYVYKCGRLWNWNETEVDK